MESKANLTKKADITVQVRELDFVTRFGKNWNALREILGIMRPIEKTPGTVLKSNVASVVLQSGAVGEGEEIPYSKASVTAVAFADLDLEKYAKAVSVEAVNKYGAEVAVQKTDDAFLNELQGKVMSDFYTFLQTGTLTSTEVSWQMAVAMAIGKVVDKFKKMHRDATETVVFVNTLDAYQYLGATQLTVQSVFGIQYVKDFMGASTMILSSELPRGKVIGCPVDNIDLYYVNPSNSDYKKLGLDYTTDGETNLIGFHANGNYSTAVGESYALMGMKLWAEYIDAISVITVGSSEASIYLDKAEISVEAGKTATLTATKVPTGATVTWTTDNQNVATVSNGTVTGVGQGIANITATAGNAKATCRVIVSAGTGA